MIPFIIIKVVYVRFYFNLNNTYFIFNQIMSVNIYFSNNLLNIKSLTALKVLIQVCVCLYCILYVFQSHEIKFYSTM